MTASPEISTDTDALAAMLADPEIRESLAVILANAPALAALASMSSALLQRGPEITDNINASILQLRQAAPDSAEAGTVTDAVRALSALAPLANTLADRKDVIQGFLDSSILQPEIVEIVGNLGEAAREADARTKGRQVTPGGPLKLLKHLRDPDVQQTVAFFLAFAEVFGQRQRSS
jgi:hypothetical protein